jgi:hypothetical protein
MQRLNTGEFCIRVRILTSDKHELDRLGRQREAPGVLVLLIPQFVVDNADQVRLRFINLKGCTLVGPGLVCPVNWVTANGTERAGVCPTCGFRRV